MSIVKQVTAEFEQKDFFPLSPMQEGMLFHTILSSNSGVYVKQICYRLRGAINISAFEKAWKAVSERHPGLRTCFIWEGIKAPVQLVREEVQVPFDQRDWRGLPQPQQQERLLSFLKSDRQRGVELMEAPLMRLMLIRLEEEIFEVIWTWHQILMDQRSSSIVAQEVITFYQAFCQGQTPQLKGSKPYRDFIAWLCKQESSEAENYWRRRLAGFTAPTPLITDRVAAGGGAHHEQHIRLSQGAIEALQSFTQRQHITFDTLVQGAWAMLLSRYSGEQEVVFGLVESERPVDLTDVESAVGLFINTLPVRVKIDPELDILTWLKIIQADRLAARRYQYTPLIEISGWSSVPRHLSLFESLILFHHAHDEAVSMEVKAGDDDLSIERVIDYEQPNYPLTLAVSASSQIILRIRYDSSRFGAATIKRMLGHLEMLFEGMVAPGPVRLSSLSVLTGKERRQAITEWNNTTREFDRRRPLHELIEVQAERAPFAVAVVFEINHITYGELNRRSNQLASYLQSLGVGPEKLVAVALDRSAEMIIALFAILKAGGAYLPLDPAYPRKRLEYILKEANVFALLTEQHLLEALPECAGLTVCIDREREEIERQRDDNLESTIRPENLAYIIYTSGSSGAPKGIQIPHRAIVNFLNSMRERPGLAGGDTLLAITTLSFDIAGLEMFLPLAAGARVVIARREAVSDGTKLVQLLEEEAVTVIQATPATYRLIVNAGWKGNKRLKFLCGGEAFPRELAEHLTEIGSDVWNLYGPTESTVWSVIHKVSSGRGPVPIGRPIANTQIYLVDSNLQPTPIGAPGEIFIGGEGIARGYLNRADLTAEKFIPDNFGAEAGWRLYRTGDSARYLDDGIIEYIGRMDFQLKVRGFRIEAEEVETVLAGHPVVAESVVVAREESPGEKRLVAYVIYHKDRKPTTKEMRGFLKDKLPEYMIPSCFVAMEKLPLTPNGKIDRRALPAPADGKTERESIYVAPRSLDEHQLVKIWEELFDRRPISVTDNFFELGGHSLLAIRAMAQIHKYFGQSLTLATLLESGTIEKLAAAFRRQLDLRRDGVVGNQ